MKCPKCGRGMRTPGGDRDPDDPLAIYRYRKCRCGNAVETREVRDDGRCAADRCAACGAKAGVYETAPVEPGRVERIRECTECLSRHVTIETIHRVTLLLEGMVG